MRIRTFTGFIPLDIEEGINHWLEVCPNITVLRIHYQEGYATDGRRVSALVEFIELPEPKVWSDLVKRVTE